MRSGEYSQDVGQLVSEQVPTNGYCCLGLLAEVAGLDPVRFGLDSFLGVSETDSALNIDDCGLGAAHHDGDMSFNSTDPETLTTLQRQLAAMNDSGKDFEEIADWVEVNVPEDAP